MNLRSPYFCERAFYNRKKRWALVLRFPAFLHVISKKVD
jgi:hypothetical protein